MVDACETPCQRAQRLRSVRDALVTGEAITEARFGEDFVKYAKADLAVLDRELAAAEAECLRSRGLTSPASRRRYALGARFRPY